MKETTATAQGTHKQTKTVTKSDAAFQMATLSF